MTIESKRMRNQKMKILRFLWRKSYSSDGGAYGLIAPGSLAGAARLVRGRAKDLRGPNASDNLRPAVDVRGAPVGDCTPEGECTPSAVGDIGGERMPSAGGDVTSGEGAKSTVGDVGAMASRVFGRVSRQYYTASGQ